MKQCIKVVLIILCLTIISQSHAQIINDNKIPASTRPLWHQAGLLPTSRTLSPETPTIADNLVVINANSSTSVDDQIDNAITNATGTTIIYSTRNFR